MDWKRLFAEKTADHQDAILISDYDLIDYLIREDIPEMKKRNHTDRIEAWFREFFVRGKTVVNYHLFPVYHYKTNTCWEQHRNDTYIPELLNACDCLYHMFIRHPELRDNLFQEKASELGELIHKTAPKLEPVEVDPFVKKICAETTLVPEQLGVFFVEKKLAVIKPPLPRFFCLTHHDLFTCLLDGLQNGITAESSSEEKGELMDNLKMAITSRNPRYLNTLMESLAEFERTIQYHKKPSWSGQLRQNTSE